MSDAPAASRSVLHRPLCPDARRLPSVSDPAPCAERARPFVLAATILASAMAFIDGSVVTIALPALQHDLDASFVALQWVVNAYALLMGGLILVGGAMGDRLGRKAVFTTGIIVFAIASLLCAIAPTVEFLVAARALKGVGAALLVPQSLAIIASSFPKEVRGRAIGIWAGASAITTAMGPPLGGFLIDALDWRAVFWINLPLSAIALALTARFVPESRNMAATGPLDWPGGVLAILAFGALTVGLTQFEGAHGSPVTGAALLALGVIGLVAYVGAEARAANPLTPLTLFRNRAFSAANVVTLFLYGAFGGVLFLLPFDLIERRALTATQVGLTLLPLGLIIGVFSRTAGSFADRLGPRPLLVTGSALVAAAAMLLAAGTSNYWAGVMAPVVIISVGMALVVAPLTTAVINAVDDDSVGAASGVNNAASRLAGLFAIAILGAVTSGAFLRRLAGDDDAGDARFGVLPPLGDAARPLYEAAFLSAYSTAMMVAALWGLAAALIAYVFLRPARTASPDAPSTA